MNHRVVKKFKLENLQSGIWYLNDHKIWVTAGVDNYINIWLLSGADKEGGVIK